MSSSDSESEPSSHKSRQEYLKAQKPRARECGHFTFAWDNHPNCVSCCLWKNLGPWGGVPCLSEENYCKLCKFWDPSLREKYLMAIRSRVANPVKFSAGRRFIRTSNINAPAKVMTFLGYPVEEVESQESEDPDIWDSSEGESQPHSALLPVASRRPRVQSGERKPMPAAEVPAGTARPDGHHAAQGAPLGERAQAPSGAPAGPSRTSTDVSHPISSGENLAARVVSQYRESNVSGQSSSLPPSPPPPPPSPPPLAPWSRVRHAPRQ